MIIKMFNEVSSSILALHTIDTWVISLPLYVLQSHSQVYNVAPENNV